MSAITSQDRPGWADRMFEVESPMPQPATASIIETQSSLRTIESLRSGPPELTLVHAIAADDAWIRTLQSLPHSNIKRIVYLFAVKRVLDVLAASLLIALLAIPMLAIAAWVRRDSQGDVIYRQKRIGYGRREFTLYKFRSMFMDADDRLAGDPELSELYRANWKLVEDPRVTRSGEFIRKFSLDELPQLFNVIKGDMSLVGPRPYMPTELRDEFGEHADLITSVTPGISGLWQVSGRSTLSPADRIVLDTEYVRSCGFRLDTLIACKTVKTILLKHGAF